MPVPASDQPDYINGAIRYDGQADPIKLLHALQAIEAEFGRQRTVPNAARTLDLDIIAIDDLVLNTADLVLPHPRMHERAFVLQPMADLAPGWRHPLLQQTVTELLAALPASQRNEVSPASHLRDGGSHST